MYCFFNKFFFKVEILGNLPIFCHAHLVAIQNFVNREILFDRSSKCPMLCLFFYLKGTIQLSFLGCAGYVVIGNTITEPSTAYDRRGLLPAGPQSRIWCTPFFSTDIWYLRRQWAQIELLMKPVCRQTEQAEPEPKKDDAAPPLCETKTGQLTFF